MQADYVTLLKEFCGRIHLLNAMLREDFSRDVAVESANFHTKTFSHACYVLGNVTESQETKLLAHQLRTCFSIESITHRVKQHTEYQFSHSVGVLARRVHHNYTVLRSSCQIYVVEACTGSHNDL